MKHVYKRAVPALLLAVTLTVSLFMGSMPAAAYQNPIDVTGEDISIGDPYILKYNGVYYLYEAYGGDVWVWQSRDLATWSEGEVCLDNTDFTEIRSGKEYKITLYAPEVKYYDGVFYLYTSPGGNGHAIYTADSPAGPFTLSEDNLGKKFDGTVMMDGDNSIYFVHPTDADDAYGLYVEEMEDFKTFIAGSETALPEANIGDRWVEGPTLFKRLGKYYLTYTGNHVWEPAYHIEYAVSDHPTYGWTEPTDNLFVSTTGKLTGLGHNSIFVGPDLDTYYITYHSIKNSTSMNTVSRSINLDRIVWNGEKMVIQGPTSWEADDPALPDFYDYFDEGSTAAWNVTGNWNGGAGFVSSQNGTLLSSATDAVFSAEYNFTLGAASTAASLLFGYVDDQNYGRVWLDSAAGALKAEIVKNGTAVWSGSSVLYSGFNYTALHTVRVQQSASQLRIVLDEVERILGNTVTAGGSIGYRTAGALTVGYTAYSHKALGSADGENFAPLPGKIEAIHFANTDVAFATVAATGKTGSAIAMTANSTATYNVSLGESTSYTLALTVANVAAGTQVEILVDGALAAKATLPAVAGTYETLNLRHVQLPAGKHRLSIRVAGAVSLYEIEAAADTAVQDGVTDFNQNSTLLWTAYETDGTVSGGTLNYAAGGSFGKMLTGDVGYTDYTVSADITFGGTATAGLLLRVQNEGDGLNLGRNVDNPAYHRGYYVRISSGGQVALYKHSLGDSTLLKSTAVTAASSLKLSVTAAGNTITVKKDGTTVLTYTDTDAPILVGRAGVKVDKNASAVTFDNFTLTAENEAVPTTRYDYIVKNKTDVDLDAFLPEGAGTQIGDDADGDGKMLVFDIAAGNANFNSGIATVTVPDPTKQYSVSMWLKSTSPMGNANFWARFTLSGATESETVTSAAVITAATSYDAWTKYTLSGVTPSADGKIEIRLWARNNNEGAVDATICLDAVTVTEEMPVTAFAPSFTATAPSTGTKATVTNVTGAADDADGDGKKSTVVGTAAAKGYIAQMWTAKVFNAEKLYTLTLRVKKTVTADNAQFDIVGSTAAGENSKVLVTEQLPDGALDWTEYTFTDLRPQTGGDFGIKLYANMTGAYTFEIGSVVVTEQPRTVTVQNIRFTDTVGSLGGIAQNRADYDGDGLWKVASLTSDETTSEADGQRKTGTIFSHTVTGLDPAKKYTVRLYVKGDGFWNADLKAYAAKTEAGEASYDAVDACVKQHLTEWTLVEFKDLSPNTAGTVKLNVWASVAAPSVTQTLYIDGLTVIEQDAEVSTALSLPVDLAGFKNAAATLYEDANRDGGFVSVTAPAWQDKDHDGKWLKVTQAANTSGAATTSAYITDLDPTKRYALTLWVKNDTAVKGANFWVNWGGTAFTAAGNPTYTVKKNGENAFVNTGNLFATVHDVWTPYTIHNIVPHANGTVQAGLWFNNTASTPATIWIDAITLEEELTTPVNTSFAVHSGVTGTKPTLTKETAATDDQNGDNVKTAVVGTADAKGYIAQMWTAKAFDPEKSYTLSVWVKKGATTGTLKFDISGTNADGTSNVVVASATVPTAASGWTEYKFTGISPKAEGDFAIKLYANLTGAFSIDLDAITVTEEIEQKNVPLTANLAKKNTGGTITTVTGAADDQNGDGTYNHYQGTWVDGRGYMIGTGNQWITGLTADKVYKAEFWIRSSGGFASGGIQVLGGSAVGSSTRATYTDKTAYETYGEWTKVTVRDIIPFADTTPSLIVNFWIQTGTSAAGTDYWIDLDNVRIIEQVTDTPVAVDLALFNKSGNAAAEDSAWVQKVTHANLDPTKTYTVSGWFDLTSAATLARLTAIGAAAQTQDLTAASGWTYVEIGGVQPSASGAVVLQLELSEGDSLSLDGLRVTEEIDIASVSDATPAGVPLPTLQLLGAAVRGTSDIRFGVWVDDRATVEDNFAVTEIRYGTLVIPSDLLGGAELTLATADVLDIPTVYWQTELPGYEDVDLYTGVVIGVPEDEGDRLLTARGYMLYQMNGQWYVAYSNAIERSVNGVYAAVEKGRNDL